MASEHDGFVVTGVERRPDGRLTVSVRLADDRLVRLTVHADPTVEADVRAAVAALVSTHHDRLPPGT